MAMTPTTEQEYEAATAHSIRGEDDVPTFAATLARLEMDRRTAERAAYAAEAEYYWSGQ
jgi:hypothetical protein